MTNKQINTIINYFDKKGMDRTQLEDVLDFDNLSMDEKYIPEIMELLNNGDDEVGENVIQNFVRYVKNRSGSGVITWEEFVNRLNDLYFPDSAFGIRVQRFSKHSYWEIFFNHYDITECEDSNTKLTFNHTCYHDEENDNAYETLSNLDIDTDKEENNVITQIADKWNEMSEDDKDEVISALNAIHTTQYVDKSRVDIFKNMIEKITMTNADLVPEVGLRDYTISFTDGDMIGLRF